LLHKIVSALYFLSVIIIPVVIKRLTILIIISIMNASYSFER